MYRIIPHPHPVLHIILKVIFLHYKYYYCHEYYIYYKYNMILTISYYCLNHSPLCTWLSQMNLLPPVHHQCQHSIAVVVKYSPINCNSESFHLPTIFHLCHSWAIIFRGEQLHLTPHHWLGQGTCAAAILVTIWSGSGKISLRTSEKFP